VYIKKQIVLVLALLCNIFSDTAGTLFAQTNLVLNPSFEDYSLCPNNFGQICRANYWFQPNYRPSNPYINVCDYSSVEYFNSCFSNLNGLNVPNNYWGYQKANNGEAYTGIYSGTFYDTLPNLSKNYREYIEGTLSEPLREEKKYCFEFYISLANKSKNATDRIGIYFDTDSIKAFQGNWHTCITHLLPITPYYETPEGYFWADTVNWMRVSGEFIAQGGERFFIIGSFRDSLEANYFTTNDTIFYGGSYYYIDDVAVWYCDEDETVSEDLFVPNAFSPNGDGNNDTLKVLGKGIAELEFAIYNRWGELIFKTHDAKQGWDGNYKGQKSEPAVYAYYVKARMRNGKEVFKKGNVTLIR
jgi:gliding motility-associated-like protein